MKLTHKSIAIVFSTILLMAISYQANASLVLAQIIDQNTPIKGMTYVDGVLFQEEKLADETYSDQFTGFVLLNPNARPIEYFNVRYNIYDPKTSTLVATLALSGGPEWILVHTAYYSTYPGAEILPWDSPTANLLADGDFHNVLNFSTDTGDQYNFQYKNIIAEVAEPETFFSFSIGLLAIAAIRRKTLPPKISQSSKIFNRKRNRTGASGGIRQIGANNGINSL
jgi:hypothetical protein